MKTLSELFSEAATEEGARSGSVRMVPPEEYRKFHFPDYPQVKGGLAGLARHFKKTDPDYFAKIRDDVQKNGFTTPILVQYKDPAGRPLARPYVREGHHRAAVAHDLGIPLPVGDYDSEDDFEQSRRGNAEWFQNNQRPRRGISWEAARRTATPGEESQHVPQPAGRPDETSYAPEDGVHRGLAVVLPPHVHALVHDPSQPAPARAHLLLSEVRKQQAKNQGPEGEEGSVGGLGNYWTPSPYKAAEYASQGGMGAYRDHEREHNCGDPDYGDGGCPTTHVVLHADTPSEAHHWTEQYRPGERYDPAISWRLPVRPGAPMRVTGISWREGNDHWSSDQRYSDEGMGFHHKTPFTQYDFSAPVRKRASVPQEYDGGDLPSRLLNRHGYQVRVHTDGHSNVELVPVYEISQYASQETDREHTREIGHQVARNGYMKPLILQYHPKSGEAYLGEGNHRLRAARALGMDHVPVRVTRNHYGLAGEGAKVPQDHPAVTEGRHVPTDIRPSEIGLSGQPLTKQAAGPTILEVRERARQQRERHGACPNTSCGGWRGHAGNCWYGGWGWGYGWGWGMPPADGGAGEGDVGGDTGDMGGDLGAEASRRTLTDLFGKTAAAPEDYARRDGENGFDHDDRVRHGLSMGHLTYDQAREHGYRGDSREETRDSWNGKPSGKGWQPLPQELYHTTTDAAGVMAHGLKSAQELGHKNGHGLGGTPQWLSMTYSAEHAHNMLDALHEYHDHLTGKTSFADLMDKARKGEGAQQPYHESLAGTVFGSNGDEVRDTMMRGKRFEPGYAAHEEAKERGWEPHPTLHTNFGEGKDGRTYGAGWERPATLYEKHDEYGAFSRARHWSGKGKPSILFVSNDREAFAKKDPKNFAVIKLRPKPGAQGFPMEGEHEWRTGTGQAVEIDGEPIRRQASNPSDNPSRWIWRQRDWDENRPQIEQTKDHDWFTLHAEPADEDEGDGLGRTRMMHAVSHDGQYLGKTFFGNHPTVPGHLEGAFEVHPEHRRKGIASAMYDWAEELGGKPMAPADSHSDYAEAFWKARNARTASVAPAAHTVDLDAMDSASRPIPAGARGTDNEGHEVRMTEMDGWAHLDGSHGHEDNTNIGDHYVHQHEWLPQGRYWGPNSAQNDQRLFDGDHLKPEIRSEIMQRVDSFMRPRYREWPSWTKVYFAGSEAAQWQPFNGDFDILIGIEYDRFRKENPQYADMDDVAISVMLTDGMRKTINVDGFWFTLRDGRKVGPFDRTFYVNPDSYDIRRLKPYAAYNVTDDTWAVHPLQVPKDWDATHLPESYWTYAEALLNEIRAIGTLPPEERHRMAANLWEELHTHRSDAFGPNGKGLFDLSNIVEKYLDQHPDKPWAKLLQWKHESPSGPEPWVPTTARRKTLTALFSESSDFGADTEGVMIAIVPPKEIGQQLLVEGGEPLEALHVTLCYLGSASEHTEDQMKGLESLVRAWARTQKPFTARVGGAGTFANPGEHVLWAHVDIPGGGGIRHSLNELLLEHGYQVRNDHGWTPHITLKYHTSHVRFLPKVEPATWDVTEVVLCIGGRWEPILLGA